MNKTLTIPIDADAERKRVLAKVYSLLLHLAENSKEQMLLPNNEEEAERSDHIHLEQLAKEALPEERMN